MIKNSLILVICGLLLLSCTNEPSLQRYFVAHSEDANFINIDLSPSVLNIDQRLLSQEEQKAFKSFEKMNILAFNLNAENASIYESERTKIEDILKEEKYISLMKFSSGMQGVSVSYLGTEEKVDEIIFYARSAEAGFAVVRILGDRITSNDMMHFVTILQKSKINLEQLKPLQKMLQKTDNGESNNTTIN
ncbi:DUF4252 domain-containing protein [Flavobacterium antarcticum]